MATVIVPVAVDDELYSYLVEQARGLRVPGLETMTLREAALVIQGLARYYLEQGIKLEKADREQAAAEDSFAFNKTLPVSPYYRPDPLPSWMQPGGDEDDAAAAVAVAA